MSGCTADVVVIGGGVVGAATARALGREGSAVTLLEAGSLAAAAGSSRGTARIIGPAAYPDESYLYAGLRALAEWRRLEAESEGGFLQLDGVLLAGEGIEAFAASLAAANVAHELLSGGEAAARFGVAGLGEQAVLYQLDGGVIRADRARGALLRSARNFGVELYERQRVVSISTGNDSVEVTTGRARWSCGRVVIAAGPWTRALARAVGIELSLSASSQSVAYFRAPERASPMPALVEFGEGDEPYALPDPERGLKAALHARGPRVDPDGPWEVIDTGALRRISAWVQARYPDVDPEPESTEACLYTNTPDEQFVLRREGTVVIGAACDGQGFQFATDTGEQLARLALEPDREPVSRGVDAKGGAYPLQ